MIWINKNVLAFVADLLGFALVLLLMPQISRQFQNLSFFNSVLMGIFFVLFCLSVFGLKKLRQTSTVSAEFSSRFLQKRTLSVLAVFFALSISTATAYVVGFLDSVVAINRGLLDEPAVTIYLLLTPASWFGLALIYMLVLTNESEASVEPTAVRYGLVSLLGLIGVNFMGLVFAAVWQAVWTRFSSVQSATVPMVLVLFVLFLLLLGPPRLIYLSRNPQLASVLTFLPFVLYLAAIAAL